MRINGNKPLLSKTQLQGLINHLFTLFVLQSLQLSFWQKIYTFLTSDWLPSFFMQCWERLILHGFLLWSCTLTLHYYCYYNYYYYVNYIWNGVVVLSIHCKAPWAQDMTTIYRPVNKVIIIIIFITIIIIVISKRLQLGDE